MIEMMNTTATNTRSLTIDAGHDEWPGDHWERAARARADYYRAYYRALVEEHARNRRSGEEGRRGLEAIKMQRRKARRERWLQGVRSLVAGVLNKSETVS